MKTLFYTISSILILISLELYGQESSSRELKQPINYDTKLIDSLLIKADSLSSAKVYNKAGLVYNEAYLLTKKSKNWEQVISIGFKIEKFYRNITKDYIKSIQILNELSIYSKQLEDKRHLIQIEINLGSGYSRLGEYVKSLSHYNRALLYLDDYDYPDLYWQTFINRGSMFLTIGDLEQSKSDSKNALKYITKQDSDNKKILTYLNISASFPNSEPDSILYYSKISAVNCSKKSTNRNCNMAYNNIAWSYYLKKKPEKALKVIRDHINLEILSYLPEDDFYPALMHTLGSIQYDLEQYNKALEFFLIAHKYFEDKKDIPDLILTKEDLSKTYEKLGDLKKSIKILREIKHLEPEQLAVRVNKELAKNTLQSKEVIISGLEQKNLKIKKEVYTIRFFSFLLVGILFVALIALIYRSYKSEIKNYKINQKLMFLRLTSLRSSMNPHFLFNTFSALQNFILKNDSKKANEYMTELSSLIRNILNSSDSVYISLSVELDIIKSYINLQRGRFEENFEVIYDIDPELLEDNPKIPAMIIQPFIENAIIHGFSGGSIKGELKIIIHKDKESIVCTIVDNGIGREASQLLKKENKNILSLNIATKNTKERIEILNQVTTRCSSIIINDLFCKQGISNGTEVIINLPTVKYIKNNETYPKMFPDR